MLFLAGGIVLVLVYGLFDPAAHLWFPRCPVHSLTGMLCPGCGSQRAIHAILHLDIAGAWKYNPMVVLALPYLVGGVVIDMVHRGAGDNRWDRQFYRGRATWIILVIILAFAILRNL